MSKKGNASKKVHCVTSLKFTNGGTLHRIFAAENAKGQPIFCDTKRRIASLIKKEANAFSLSYTDDDGDCVCIKNTKGLRAAFSNGVPKGKTCLVVSIRDEEEARETMEEDSPVHSLAILSARLRELGVNKKIRNTRIFSMAIGKVVVQGHPEDVTICCPLDTGNGANGLPDFDKTKQVISDKFDIPVDEFDIVRVVQETSFPVTCTVHAGLTPPDVRITQDEKFFTVRNSAELLLSFVEAFLGDIVYAGVSCTLVLRVVKREARETMKEDSTVPKYNDTHVSMLKTLGLDTKIQDVDELKMFMVRFSVVVEGQDKLPEKYVNQVYTLMDSNGLPDFDKTKQDISDKIDIPMGDFDLALIGKDGQNFTLTCSDDLCRAFVEARILSIQRYGYMLLHAMRRKGAKFTPWVRNVSVCSVGTKEAREGAVMGPVEKKPTPDGYVPSIHFCRGGKRYQFQVEFDINGEADLYETKEIVSRAMGFAGHSTVLAYTNITGTCLMMNDKDSLDLAIIGRTASLSVRLLVKDEQESIFSPGQQIACNHPRCVPEGKESSFLCYYILGEQLKLHEYLLGGMFVSVEMVKKAMLSEEPLIQEYLSLFHNWRKETKDLVTKEIRNAACSTLDALHDCNEAIEEKMSDGTRMWHIESNACLSCGTTPERFLPSSLTPRACSCADEKEAAREVHMCEHYHCSPNVARPKPEHLCYYDIARWLKVNRHLRNGMVLSGPALLHMLSKEDMISSYQKHLCLEEETKRNSVAEEMREQHTALFTMEALIGCGEANESKASDGTFLYHIKSNACPSCWTTPIRFLPRDLTPRACSCPRIDEKKHTKEAREEILVGKRVTCCHPRCVPKGEDPKSTYLCYYALGEFLKTNRTFAHEEIVDLGELRSILESHELIQTYFNCFNIRGDIRRGIIIRGIKDILTIHYTFDALMERHEADKTVFQGKVVHRMLGTTCFSCGPASSRFYPDSPISRACSCNREKHVRSYCCYDTHYRLATDNISMTRITLKDKEGNPDFEALKRDISLHVAIPEYLFELAYTRSEHIQSLHDSKELIEAFSYNRTQGNSHLILRVVCKSVQVPLVEMLKLKDSHGKLVFTADLVSCLYSMYSPRSNKGKEPAVEKHEKKDNDSMYVPKDRLDLVNLLQSLMIRDESQVVHAEKLASSFNLLSVRERPVFLMGLGKHEKEDDEPSKVANKKARKEAEEECTCSSMDDEELVRKIEKSILAAFQSSSK